MPPDPQSPILDLDADVRRVDEDRWLASRFAPADVRARLTAIYAINHEIARTAEVVSTAQLIDIRLAWWREALDEIYAGKPPRAHPALAAFAVAAPFAPDRWTEIIEARRTSEPFASWESVDAFVEKTARALMSIAVEASGASAQEVELVAPLLTDLARAWGCVALARSSWFASRAPGPLSEALERASSAYAKVRANGARIPPSAFPAVGYVTLVPGYSRALQRGERERPLLTRQLRLIAAAATGQL